MKNFIIITLLILGFGSIVLAAPYFRQEATIVPISDNAYDLGTTTQRWRNIYAVTASSTNLIVSGLNAAACDVKASTNGTFSCGTDSTGASVADLVATSTNETAGRLSYWTTTSGTPAKLGEVATTTLTATSPLSLDNPVVKVGGSNSILSISTAGTWSGLAGTATALAANGANCSAGNYPLGVDASGAVESCTAASTGTVTSVGVSSSGTLTIGNTPVTTSGTITADLNLGNANTWTAAQLFNYTATTSFSGGLYGSLVSAPYFHATSTTATSTFSGNAHIVGNLQVDGNFFAPVTLISSSDFTVQGKLTVTGALDFDTFTSAILLTGAGGDVAEYAGTSCTNQFVRSLSALGAATCATVANTDLANSTISGIALGSNLADLTATNGSLTFSGTYNGSTARTIGLNVGNANAWTALQTFTNASSTQFSAATQTFYVDSSGRVQTKDTTNGWSGVTSPTRSFALETATTTTWTGTTSPAYVPSITMPFAGTLRQMRCAATSTSAFLNVSPFVGTTRPTPTNVVASTTVGTIVFTANNTFSAGTSISMYVGSSTADANNIGVSCTFEVTETY